MTIAAALVAALLPTAVGCAKPKESPDLQPHLIATPEEAPVRPIDSFETAELSPVPSGDLTDAQYRARLDELYYTVVDDGKKPIFSDGDPVKAVYDAAIEILDTYILNSWHGNDDGEYKTAHALHDYLAYYIEYDQELYIEYQNGNTDVQNDPAFGIDGVFLNKLAVCDGLSRAYAFLCAIEGIESIRMVGTYAGGPHAWNKVRVGGKWYNADVTADMAHYVVSAGKSTEYKHQIAHGHFMLSDETYRTFRPQMHVFSDTSACDALEDMEYFDGKAVSVNGTSYPSVITDQATLNSLFKSISSAKGAVGKIEIQLRFPDKANINDGDMYKAEIDEAYAHLKNPDFALNESQRPYFHYPNGVYLFLMYK